MQNTIDKKYLRNGVLLSILLHLLILLSMTKVIFSPVEKKSENKHFYVPSYTVPSTSVPARQEPMRSSTQSSPITPQQTQTKGNTSTAKPLEKPVTSSAKGIYRKSVLDMSRDILQHNQFSAAVSRPKDVVPMLLIGDTSQAADPIVQLIGRSLSANFHYPRMEGSFGVRGKVLVEMVLHPEGYYSDVQIVKSSNNPNFDSAALYAVNTAPKVVGVDKLLSKPLDFIVGFIFD